MNYPRTRYEMSEADMNELLAACEPVPCLLIGGIAPSSPQENANRAWARLGRKMGFDHMTVLPDSQGELFFTAVPSETEDQRVDRLKTEAVKKRADDIERIQAQIWELKTELEALLEAQP